MSNDYNELKNDLEDLVGKVTILESAKEALNERAKELQEKYENSTTFDDLKAAQLKKMATLVYRDSVEQEKEKTMVIFDILESMED